MSMAPMTPSPQEQLHLMVGGSLGGPRIAVRRAMNSRPWVEAGTFKEAWSAVEGEGEFHLVVGFRVIVPAGAPFHHGHLAALLLVIDRDVPL